MSVLCSAVRQPDFVHSSACTPPTLSIPPSFSSLSTATRKKARLTVLRHKTLKRPRLRVVARTVAVARAERELAKVRAVPQRARDVALRAVALGRVVDPDLAEARRLE